ncbi:carbohydrate binding domain containing protein [Histomonas meleagridis]|uniref:carbohydrate binding domain containing protein n=1 Tax=Histomonas meleagridis TaxID=135588 RepID=UPI00355A7026|nr:carbohydrate binding domain containing protein [Histomonas meleagridis]KAH0803751.1 carbohydrate binding domain containing protein [Histomonas meleagridis]
MILFYALCIDLKSNYVINPSFETGLSNWGFNDNTCTVTSEVSHSGKYSIHCHDTSGERNSLAYQGSEPLENGFYYKLSAWIRMKDCTSQLLVYAENWSPYASGIYAFNTQNSSCSNNNCNDQWYYIERISLEPINSTRPCVVGFGLRDKGTGEYWIDDITLTPVYTSLLKSADVTCWRQEAYKDKTNVIVDLGVKNTHWENGEDLSFDVDFINQETGRKELTLTKFTIKRNIENIYANFVLDPKLLTPGYYNISVTLHNLFCNTDEHIQTHIHILSEKRDYAIFIDDKMRTIDHGKVFFPLGLYYYCGYSEEIIRDYIASDDSPFNLIIGGGGSKAAIERVYNITHGKIRVIDIGTGGKVSYNNATERKELAQKLSNYAKTVKDSPGLFAYYHLDEPTIEAVPSLHENLIALREADPNHPVYTAIAANHRLDLPYLKEGIDCFGSDIYPVQNFDQFNAVYIVSYQSRNAVINNRAHWGIPQFFSWKYYDNVKHANELPPTYDQLRQMTYQMIVGGANGLIYYDFGSTFCGPHQPWQNEWEKLKKVANELMNNYIPIIISGNDIDPGYAQPTFPREIIDGRECGVRFFNYDGYDYVLVVNVWQFDSKECTFFKPSTTSDIQIITGSSTIKNQTDTTLTLSMPAMDVTWLKITNEAFNGKKGLSTTVKVIISMIAVCIVIGVYIGVAIFDKRKNRKDFSDSKT